MTTKPKSAVKSKTASKGKSAVIQKKVINLKQSEFSHLAKDIISNVNIGIYIVQKGRFVYVSPLFEKLSGYSSAELIGAKSLDYLHPDDRETLRKKAIKSLKKKISNSYEYRFIRKNGDVMFVLEMISSITYKGERATLGSFMDVTERKQAQEALRQSEEKYRTILEEMEDAYFEVDIAGNFIFVNDAICRHLGYTREELIGATFRSQMAKEDYDRVYKDFGKMYLTGKPARGISCKLIRKDGVSGFAEMACFPVKNQQGEVIGFRGVGRDITERKQIEETLRQSEERYRTIIDEMEEWYFETDLSGNVTFFNDVFARALGYSQKEITGLNFRSFVKKEDSESIYRLFNKVFKTGESTKNFLYEFIRTDDTVTSTEFSIFPKRNKEGEIYGFRGIGHDITERKRAEEKIQYMATHDALTGLPNRLMFSQILNHAIQSAKRYKRKFAVFFIDLDRFKIVNDTLGHEVGDQLLQEIAERLKQTLRAVDVVARMGGDEFVILIEEINDTNQAATVAHEIIASVIKPLSIMGHECRITASIGICMYPHDAQNEQTLMKNADIAMYFAKEEGKNNYQFYSNDIHSKSLARLSIETNLRYALERNELHLHYQAKVDFKTNAITGVEALLRWQSPALGSVTPTQFIPIAEETGLIVPIGRWVMQAACAQNVSWQRDGLPPVGMAINLSPRQLTDDNLIIDIKNALKNSGMDPSLLELEITESMVMHNTARMLAVLNKIKNLGVHLAIDDFGTGYSSLAQFKRFPVDTLKVDRSFIRNIHEDIEDQAITEAIISMGKTLRITVVAEGVETEQQMNFLREHFCDEMQGFYFSKPIVPHQFADLLRKHDPSLELVGRNCTDS